MVRNLPDADRRSKTDEILGYFISRSNEEVSIERIATDLGMNQKIVGSIASRLAARGIIARKSRGVYVHKEEEVRVSVFEGILRELEETIRKAFGKRIAGKTGISKIKDRESISGLEEALERMKGIIGKYGAIDLLWAVTKKVAKPSEFKHIVAKMGISK